MAQQKSSQNNHPVNQNKNQPNTKAKAGPEQLASKDSSIETELTVSASQVNNKTGNQAAPVRPITSRRDRKQHAPSLNKHVSFPASFVSIRRSVSESFNHLPSGYRPVKKALLDHALNDPIDNTGELIVKAVNMNDALETLDTSKKNNNAASQDVLIPVKPDTRQENKRNTQLENNDSLDDSASF